MTNKQFDQRLEEILTPLFVQARQEALQELNRIPLNRTGVITSTPAKTVHLTNEAKSAIVELIAEGTGPDEAEVANDNKYLYDVMARNELRAQLRNTFGVKGE